MDCREWVERNRKYTLVDGDTGFSLGFAGMKFSEADLDTLAPAMERAAAEMRKIESGEIKNPDENRKVTHFTDRQSYVGGEIHRQIEKFAADLRAGRLLGSTGKPFRHAVINGIGGSALGPQLAQFAVNGPYWNELDDEARGGALKIYFTDNTDTAGVDDILDVVDLERTLVANVSKSGGTQETKNNMIAFERAYADRGLDFAKHACAITMAGSSLDQHARGGGWLAVFEMAESIGGRTSETSVVGHLPAALGGLDFAQMLKGALRMDEMTRAADFKCNPAYMLAAAWHIAGGGRGERNMVIVPYSDRLILMSRYLQQLVMESLGKEKNLRGETVHQGLNVFGNKGGTDAHAFIQQLNDGRDDFFVTFIEVLEDAMNIPVDESGVAMGDYLHGFQAGLSAALRGKGRQVIEMTIERVDEFNLGMLIALYERAVAVYAELIGVNAFHQPGVQSYKLASGGIIKLLGKVRARLTADGGFSGAAAEFAAAIGEPEAVVEVAGILAKFAANPPRLAAAGAALSRQWDTAASEWRYTLAKA